MLGYVLCLFLSLLETLAYAVVSNQTLPQHSGFTPVSRYIFLNPGLDQSSLGQKLL